MIKKDADISINMSDCNNVLVRTGTTWIVISVLVWITSIGIASYEFWIGFAVWIFSLIILVAGWSSNSEADKADKRMKEQALVYFGAEDMDDMTGLEFETFLESVFRVLGYNVSTTNTTGDYGVDLLLKKNDSMIAVQTKRHSNNIGNKAVQEVYAGLAHYGADEGWVITNSYFTKSAIIQANSTNIKLVDRENLIEYIVQAKTVIDSSIQTFFDDN